MSKYIDADLLRKEIERRFWDYGTPLHNEEVTKKVDKILDFLDTLPDEPNHLEEALELVAEYDLKPYRDGNAWCILLGKDIQSGICGFGDTRLDAMLEFKKEYDSYVKRTHLYPAKEQPAENLDAEIDRFYRSDEYKMSHELGRGFEVIAYHFFDFGCRRTAVMYDDIEYNRQMAEESELSGDLEEEVKRYWNEHALEYRIGRVADIDFLHLTARHFAEWGAEHLKKYAEF